MTSSTQYCILQKDIFKSVGEWLLIFWECLTPMKNYSSECTKKIRVNTVLMRIRGWQEAYFNFRVEITNQIVFFQSRASRREREFVHLISDYDRRILSINLEIRDEIENFPAGIDLGQVAPPSQPPPLQSALPRLQKLRKPQWWIPHTKWPSLIWRLAWADYDGIGDGDDDANMVLTFSFMLVW